MAVRRYTSVVGREYGAHICKVFRVFARHCEAKVCSFFHTNALLVGRVGIEPTTVGLKVRFLANSTRTNCAKWLAKSTLAMPNASSGSCSAVNGGWNSMS